MRFLRQRGELAKMVHVFDGLLPVTASVLVKLRNITALAELSG